MYLGHGPIERHARAGIFLQGFAIGSDGLLEPRRPALPLAERCERSAEIHLGRGPIAWVSFTGPQLKEPTIALDRRLGGGVIAEFIPLPVESVGL